MRQENKDQEKLLLSRMHILMLTSGPAVHCSVPFQKAWLETQDRNLPGWACAPGRPRLPLPPQFGVDVPMPVPKATPAPVTTQLSCSVLCREDEEEPNLIYSVLHFHAK